MTAEPARPGPVDCLQRGLRSLRANWQLAPVVAAQTVLTVGLTLAGFFILLTGLGVSVGAWTRDLGPAWPEQIVEQLALGLESDPTELLPRLLLPLLAATLVWTLAFGIYCYLQAGVMGVLAGAEIGAGAGQPGWSSYRRFSLAGFDAQGRLLFWRYFWFNHLLGAVLLVWMTLLLGLMALAVQLAAGPATEVGVAVGCAGLAPLGLLLFAAALWSMLATVEVARPGAGVWAAARRALTAMRQRLGAVLLVWLMAFGGWMIVGAALAPIKWGFALASGDRFGLWIAGRGALALIETLLDSALLVALIATLAALVGLRQAGQTEVGP